MRAKSVFMSALVVAMVWAAMVSGRRAAVVAAVETQPAAVEPLVDPLGMTEAEMNIRSAGALAFGPDGVLLIGDSVGAQVFAVDVGTGTAASSTSPVRLAHVDRQIASLLGTSADQIAINDMKVQRSSQDVYFSVTRGLGNDRRPALVRLRAGTLESVALDRIRHSRLALEDAPAAGAKTAWGADMQPMTITDLAFVDGRVYVAGLSREAFASRLRIAPFPFGGRVAATSVEIFHTSHNRYETQAPIETFLPLSIGGTPSLLAGYGCAPIAIFKRAELQSGEHVRGRTVAELGGGNRPTDMIALDNAGKSWVIVANSDRTLMRIRVDDLVAAPALTSSVPINEAAGVPYVSIAAVGVLQLDDLNKGHVIAVQRDIRTGSLDLRSLDKRFFGI